VVGTVTSLPSFIAAPTARATDAAKPPSAETQARRDNAVRADISDAAYQLDVAAAREEVAAARSALDLFIAVAKEARSLLLEARDLATRAADPATPDAARALQDVPFRARVQELQRLIDGAVSKGLDALAGGTVAAVADPDGQDIAIAGLDLRVKGAADEAAAVRLSSGSTIATAPDAARAALAADESIARVDAGLRRIEVDAARLTGHQDLLAALESAVAGQVRADLDAESARLIALQVRQDLSRASAPIANAKPSAVLALFRE
jgi:flagellin